MAGRRGDREAQAPAELAEAAAAEDAGPRLHAPSALERAHAEGCRLGEARDPAELGARRSLSYGPRGLKFPLLALQAEQQLGPVRHALAQRTVAGVMQVHFPPPARAVVRPAPASGPGSTPSPDRKSHA